MKSNAKCYSDLKVYVDTLPVIDCHDHAAERAAMEDVICNIMGTYTGSDIHASSSDKDAALLRDKSISIEERWPIFEKAWQRMKFTGYGQMTRRAIKKVFDEDAITLESVLRMQENMPDFTDPAVYDKFYDDANISARILNGWMDHKKIMDGSWELLPRQYLVIPLPGFHHFKKRDWISGLEKLFYCTVTSLDEYLEICRKVFEGYKKFGAVAFKDQSAYSRTLEYKNPPRADAEAVFNRIIADPRYSAEYDPYNDPLSDFLMHCFMRMARDMEMPVQIHTGHMAGIRNDAQKTNAAGLRSLLEIHRDVQFDLFHANWPYSGDLLYLCKNYPNVSIDFCWAHIIDPVYCRDMLMQAVSSVPHGKIHGFGSDVGGGSPHMAWAHCEMARENIAAALAELVDIDYIDLDDAKEIAESWLFSNPNRFFKLSL